MSYARYESYSDSGLQWLGKIPSHWEVVQSRRLFEQRKERARDGDEQLTASQKYGIISQKKFMELENQRVVQVLTGSELLKHIEPNDFVISMRSFQGGLEWSRQSGCVSSAYIGLIPIKHVVPEFYNYLFKCGPYIQALQSTSNLVRDGQALRFENFSQVWLPIIPDDEQQKIANFLDHETAKIDTLIDKQQQLIRLLKEKRQAVISHAVTKGLNPNAPMRDSGVEWLGEVPEHWVTTRLKYMKSQVSNAFVDGPFGSNLKSEHFLENGDVYVIESNFATTGLLDTSKLKKISNNHYETIKRSSAKGGDIIIAKIGARYGSSSILPEVDKKAVVSGNSLKLTVNENLLNVEYANELLRVLKQNDAMDDGVNVTAQPALSLGGLNNLPFLKLPIEEQKKIVGYIKSAKNKYDELIFNADRFIDLAKERRTALISAAVTGKIDVRHHVSRPTGNDTSEVSA